MTYLPYFNKLLSCLSFCYCFVINIQCKQLITFSFFFRTHITVGLLPAFTYLHLLYQDINSIWTTATQWVCKMLFIIYVTIFIIFKRFNFFVLFIFFLLPPRSLLSYSTLLTDCKIIGFTHCHIVKKCHRL